MSLYYLLARMERTSDYVRQVPLPSTTPLFGMGELGQGHEQKKKPGQRPAGRDSRQKPQKIDKIE